jgi:hypothetical protein
LETFL